MSRRANLAHRCPDCLLHLSLCLCAELPRLETRTRVLLVLHRDEARKPTNTGRLAARSLVDSELVIRGERGHGEPPLSWPAERTPLLLFPSDDAAPLADAARGVGPITLIVPDGTWRQAFKLQRRAPALATVPRVRLPEGPATEYRLRAPVRPSGLSTIEAVARALGVLDGPEIEAALLRVFHAMVDRTLWARGALPEEGVRGGVPVGAAQHEPGRESSARARRLV